MTKYYEVSIRLPSGKVVSHKYPTNRKAAGALAVFQRIGHDATGFMVERTPLDLTEADGTLVLGPVGSPRPSQLTAAMIDDAAALTDEDRRAIDGLGDDLVARLLAERDADLPQHVRDEMEQHRRRLLEDD